MNPEQFTSSSERSSFNLGLELPDPTKDPSVGNDRYKKERPFLFQSQSYLGRVIMTPYIPKPEHREVTGPRALLEIEIEDPSKKSDLRLGRSIAFFRCQFQEAPILPRAYQQGDETEHRYWDQYGHRIHSDYRRRGLAAACLTTLESLMMEMAYRDARVQAEWIQTDTKLSSWSRLIVARTWLRENGLERLKGENAMDFGYLPHPLDQERAVELVQGTLVAVEEIVEESNQSPVRFLKRTSS